MELNKRIYQVHRIGGCWEDYYDIIEGTFFNKKNAELMAENMGKAQEAKLKKSGYCQVCAENDYDKVDCPYREMVTEEDWECCMNEFTFYDIDTEEYRVEEVEVLDAE